MTPEFNLSRGSAISLGRIAIRGLRSMVLGPKPPINLRTRDAAAIDRAVAYAISNAQSHLVLLEQLGLAPTDINLLELGPGIDFGPMLILASHGVRAAVADRFLSPWDDAFHPGFYRRLRDAYDGPHSAIDAVIEAGRYVETAITLITEPAEKLASVADASFDVVISNAVLEHVEDVAAVARTLARITRRGGTNVHQIDLRDHSNFDKPLESLMRADWLHAAEFRQTYGEIGNRVRLSEFVEMFGGNGFEIVDVDRNMIADADYLRRVVPSLRKSSSRYRDWPTADLEVISAKLTLVRA